MILKFFKLDQITIMGVIIGFITSYITPVAPFLIITFSLILCDMITGIRAARHRNEPIRSRSMGKTIDKIILYFMAILLAEMFRTVFLNNNTILDNFPLVYMVSITISIREFKSVLENIEVVTGANIWAQIGDKLKDILKLMK